MDPSTTDWIIVAITAAYTVIAFLTLVAIKRQADIAERALTAERIPYVYVSSAERSATLTTGDERNITVRSRSRSCSCSFTVLLGQLSA